MMTFAAEVETKLRKRKPRRFAAVEFQNPAAVLVPLFERSDELHLLLTRRTETVATHKGHISFPGGVCEPGDASLCETALREAEEEIGLRPSDVRILGELDDYQAVTDHLVRPVVAWIPAEYDYRLQADEVDYLLEVPVDFFRRTAPRIEKRLHQGLEVDVYFFDFAGENIWGLTARIIRDFLHLLDSD